MSDASPAVRVLFAPDWRDGNLYQQLLADALGDVGVGVEFLNYYRRFLPLTRGSADFQFPIVHLHWPEAYYHHSRPGDGWRYLRWPLDLWATRRKAKLVLTAHNLVPHDRDFAWAHWAVRKVYRAADAVIAHSAGAADQIVEFTKIDRARLWVIPHGDLSSTVTPFAREQAREALQLENQLVALMFGVVRPYKGIDRVMEYLCQAEGHAFSNSRPVVLAVVGNEKSKEYGIRLRALAQEMGDLVRLELGWKSSEELSRWLSASDVAVFHHHRGLTSGAACLARSLGVPMILPEQWKTIDLAEPSARVARFDAEASSPASFFQALEKVSQQEPAMESAEDYRQATSWANVARQTAEVYRQVLG